MTEPEVDRVLRLSHGYLFCAQLKARHRIQRAILLVKFGLRSIRALVDSNERRYAINAPGMHLAAQDWEWHSSMEVDTCSFTPEEILASSERAFRPAENLTASQREMRQQEVDGFRERRREESTYHLPRSEDNYYYPLLPETASKEMEPSHLEMMSLTHPFWKMQQLCDSHATRNRKYCGSIEHWDLGFFCTSCEEQWNWCWNSVSFIGKPEEKLQTAYCAACGEPTVIPGPFMPSSEMERARILALCHAVRFNKRRALQHLLQRSILLVKFHLRFIRLWIESNRRHYASGGAGAAIARGHFESLL